MSLLVMTLSLGSAGAATLNSNTTIAADDVTYDGQDLTVQGATLTINGRHSFGSMWIANGAILTHSAAPVGEGSNLLNLTLAGDLVVDAASRIDLSGCGYGTGQGPGAGTRNGGGWGGGASHGGLGGTQVNGATAPGGAYDSVTTPSQWGSGGGGGSGGPGGGLAWLTVTGTLRIDGTLTADGAPSGGCCGQQGGGAGGSWWINAGTLAGSGSIAARGGAGGVAGGGGGGGGGRIALYFGQNTFTGILSARGGVGYQTAGAGTIYTRSFAEPSGHLLVENGGNPGAWTPLIMAEPMELVVAQQGRASAMASLTATSLHVLTYGTLSYAAGLSNFTITVLGDASIESGAAIDLAGMGWGPEQGPGAGMQNGGGWGTGAGHGGVGGTAANYGGAAGGVYDPILTPLDWGSGGGGSAGGAGGGAAKLDVAGTLRIDGALVADGSPSGGCCAQQGGGAGGSWWINSETLAGGGSISACGGAGGVTGGGGGGGGGRIALYLSQNNFAGTISAVGGLGYENGGAGTIFTQLAADPRGTVLVDNSTNAGATRLNSSLWPATSLFNLTIAGAAIVKPDAPQTFWNLVVTNRAVVTHDAGQAGLFWACLGNAWIGSEAAFDVDGMGFGALAGPGTGNISVYGYGSGAGHGGTGGESVNGGYWGSAVGGGSYGASNAPITLGSGAGGGGGTGGGAAGGGAIRLSVNGALYLLGSVSANGAVASTTTAGSGAGGSIWITADTLVGHGSLMATGGNATSFGAAGGGGRIALWVRDRFGYSGTVSAAGGAGRGDGGGVGLAGTIYYSVPAPTIQHAARINGSLDFSWLAASGQNYQVQYSTNLSSGNWVNLGSPQNTTGGTLSVTDPAGPDSMRFYRILLVH